MFHTNLVRYMRIKEKTPKDFYNNKDPRLNISKSQFFKLRRGDDYPQVETILKMAKVLGVEPNELTKRDDKEGKKKTPDDFDKFLKDTFLPLAMGEMKKTSDVFLSRDRFEGALRIIVLSLCVVYFTLGIFVALMS